MTIEGQEPIRIGMANQLPSQNVVAVSIVVNERVDENTTFEEYVQVSIFPEDDADPDAAAAAPCWVILTKGQAEFLGDMLIRAAEHPDGRSP
jgi:hypothetical protein